MKTNKILTVALAAAALGASVDAAAQYQGQYDYPAVPLERIYVQPANPPAGPIHGGFITDTDAVLLSDAVGAVDSDRRLDGSVVTMVADHGVLTVNGTTLNVVQATRMEQKLKGLHGGTRVYSWFDSPGA